jgi:periplasmic divalent cation tolerance protein
VDEQVHTGDHALVLVTCGTVDEASAIARALVETRLAAGVQIVPIESVYRWSGEVVDDREWLLVVKTRRDRFGDVERLVLDLHSYEVAPVLMIGIDEASKPYLAWIDGALGEQVEPDSR